MAQSNFLTHNAGTKIISVFIAFLLWFVVQGSKKVEFTKEIPVNVILPESLVLTEQPEPYIKAHLSGPKALLRAVENRVEEGISINLTSQNPGRVIHRIYPQGINVPIGVKVLRVDPSELSLTLEKLATKSVKIQTSTLGTPAEGYEIQAIDIQPKDWLDIKGPRSKIKLINEIKAQVLDVNNLSDDYTKELALELPSGVTIDGPPPLVTIKLKAVTANFKVRNVKIRVLSQHKVRMVKSSVVVYVRATQPEIERLDQNRIYAEVDLKGAGKGDHTAEVQVRLPPEIDLVKVVPDKIRLTLF